MLFESFSLSYLISSTITLVTDIFCPFLRYKSSSTEHVIENYHKIMKVTLKNIVTSIPVFYAYEWYIGERENNNNPFIYNFVLWLMITDISFYIFHRSLHHPKLYYLHKLHHQYRYAFGPAALYSSLTEFYLSNIVPNLISFELLKLSSDEMVIIIIFETFYTVIISHGCYKFTNQSHLKHHLEYKEPYGLFLSDHLFDLNNIFQINYNR